MCCADNKRNIRGPASNKWSVCTFYLPMMGTQAELEALDPIGQDGVNVTSAGLSAQYEKMWRVTFSGSTVEGDVETLQVTSTLIVALHFVTPFFYFLRYCLTLPWPTDYRSTLSSTSAILKCSIVISSDSGLTIARSRTNSFF